MKNNVEISDNDQERMEKLKQASMPLLKLLCEEYHPHHAVIITGTSIELMEGKTCIPNVTDFVQD